MRVVLSLVVVGIVGLFVWFLTDEPAPPLHVSSDTEEVADDPQSAPVKGAVELVVDNPTTAPVETLVDASEEPTSEEQSTGAAIRGWLVDDAGENSGGTVTLHQVSFPDDVLDAMGGTLWRLFDRKQGAFKGRIRNSLEVVSEAEADSDGRFVFQGLEPGSYIVSAHREGFTHATSRIVELFDETSREQVILEFAEAHTMVGSVTREDGSPVIGAQVQVTAIVAPLEAIQPATFLSLDEIVQHLINPIARSAETDEVGEFQIPELLEVPYRVFVQSPPLASAEEVHAPATDPPLEIVLAAGATVSGVLSLDDEPVSGADVIVVREDGRQEGLERLFDTARYRTDSNQDGGFQVEGLPASKYRVVVRAQGKQERRILGVHLEAGEEEFLEIELAEGFVIEGQVFNGDGDPAASVRVVARQLKDRDSRGRRQRGMRARTRTDESGEFRFDTLQEGDYSVRFDAREDLSKTVVVTAGSERIEVELEAGLTLVGAVLARDGEPIEDARIIARQKGHRSRWTRTAATGEFTVSGLVDEVVQLSVSAHGYFNTRVDDIDIGIGSVDDIVLEQAITIEGFVLDPEGQPLAGARVRAVPAHYNPNMEWRRRRSVPTNHSEEDGYFYLTLPRPDETWLVHAEYPQLESAVSDALYANAADITNLRLQLGWGATVQGTVITQSGAVVSGAKVALHEHNPDRGVPRGQRRNVKNVRALGDGTFVFAGLSEGSYFLTATAPGYARNEPERITLQKGGRHELTVSLAPEQILIGFVRDTKGDPLSGVRVYARSEEQNQRASATSRLDGSFECAGLGRGTCRVYAVLTGHGSWWRRDIDPGAPLEIVLTERQRLFGFVLNAETDEPIHRARVRVEDVNNHKRRKHRRRTHTVHTDSAGRFEVLDLNPAQYRVRVRARDFLRQEHVVELGKKNEEVSPMSLRLTPGSRVAGLVVGKDGRPLSEVRVLLYQRVKKKDGNWRSTTQRPLARTRTDADGIFEHTGLEAGFYLLLFRHRDYLGTQQDLIEVRNRFESTTEVRAVLERGASVEGIVRTETGQRVHSGFAELVAAESDYRRRTRVSEEGNYRLSGLPPGRYVLSYLRNRKGDPEGSLIIDLTPRQSRRLDLRAVEGS